MAADQFVAGQRVLLPTQKEFTRLHNRRLGILEYSPGPARFELIQDIDFAVAGGIVMYMFAPADMNQFHLISAAAAVYTPGSGDIEIMIENLTQGVDMLTTPIVIAGGDQTSYPSGDPTIAGIQSVVVTGDIIAVDVTSGDSDALGLGVALSYA